MTKRFFKAISYHCCFLKPVVLSLLLILLHDPASPLCHLGSLQQGDCRVMNVLHAVTAACRAAESLSRAKDVLIHRGWSLLVGHVMTSSLRSLSLVNVSPAWSLIGPSSRHLLCQGHHIMIHDANTCICSLSQILHQSITHESYHYYYLSF